MSRATHSSVLTLILLTAIGCFQSASAEGAFVGASAGWSHSSYDTADYNALVQHEAAPTGDTVSVTGELISQDASAWWANAGYWFGENFGIDAAYLHLGGLTYDMKGSVMPATAGGPISASARIGAQGPALSLLGRLPLTGALELDVRAGDYYADTRLDSTILFQTATHSTKYSSSASSLLVGAGASYAVNGRWSLRLDYLHVGDAGDSRVGTLSASLVTAGVTYTF